MHRLSVPVFYSLFSMRHDAGCACAGGIFKGQVVIGRECATEAASD